MEITFDQLPKAVSQLYNKLENIERLLLSQSSQDNAETDQFLTIQEAAKFINLAVPTIYAMVAKNQIPFSKKSKRLYFSKQELTDFIKSGRKKTVSEIEAEAINAIGSKSKKG